MGSKWYPENKWLWLQDEAVSVDSRAFVIDKAGILYVDGKLVGLNKSQAWALCVVERQQCLTSRKTTLVPVEWARRRKDSDLRLLRYFEDQARGFARSLHERAVSKGAAGGKSVAFVYAFCDGVAHHKIGIAQDVSVRLRGVQTGCPTKITVASFVQCDSRSLAQYIESESHRSLESHRTHGEWFRCSSAMARSALVAAMKKGGGRSELVEVADVI